MPRLQNWMVYHGGNASADCWGDPVALPPDHGLGELIDGRLRLHVRLVGIFLELIIRCESAAVGSEIHIRSS